MKLALAASLAVALAVGGCGGGGSPGGTDDAAAARSELTSRTVSCIGAGKRPRPTVLCALCRQTGGGPILQVIPADLVVIPERARILARSRVEPGRLRDLEYTIALAGQQLIAQVFWCPGCRRRIGWGIAVDVAVLRRLDGSHRRELQRALGFPDTPVLETARDWAAAPPIGPPAHRPDFVACRAAP